eukprot:70263-Amphidinium_carterae.1
MLSRLWPAMSEEAGVGEMPVPDTSSLETVLPLVAMSISRKTNQETTLASKNWELLAKDWELEAKKNELEDIRKKVRSWPDQYYSYSKLPNNGSNRVAKEWLSAHVKLL